MYYQVEGYKAPQAEPKYMRYYTSSQRDEARTYAKHLVEKCQCDTARVLNVASAESFLASPQDGTAISNRGAVPSDE